MSRCSWCNTKYEKWQNRCDACGGPMPPPPGMELGPVPPPPVRQLPRIFVKKTWWSENVAMMVGCGGLAMGVVGFLLLVAERDWKALFMLIFVASGGMCIYQGVKIARNKLKALRHGTAITGIVSVVHRDKLQSVNNQHPWKLVYHFTLNGTLQEGHVISYDEELGKRERGQPLWILYMENEPGVNTPYPPIV